jgi:hypothetical protein
MTRLVGRPILAAADFQSAPCSRKAASEGGCRLIARPTKRACGAGWQPAADWQSAPRAIPALTRGVVTPWRKPGDEREDR